MFNGDELRILSAAVEWQEKNKNGGWVGYSPNLDSYHNENIHRLRGMGLLKLKAEYGGPYLHHYYRINTSALLELFLKQAAALSEMTEGVANATENA